MDINKFIESLTPKELKAFNIAKTHLGSSFSAEKSIMYLKWVKAQSQSS